MTDEAEATPKITDELIDAVRLNLVPGIGPRIQRDLLDCFGSPADVFAASINALQQVPRITAKIATALKDSQYEARARNEIHACSQRNVRLIPRQADNYPAWLAEIPDPPSVLYVQGTLLPQDEFAVAIVGSRNCTRYGIQQAERLARDLALAGVTIISGLARGIDGAAHRGALEAGGRTIAVFATGLANIYPPEHGELACEIRESGALLTEAVLHQLPKPGLFPQRNRIISGLSRGVVVVEASRRSGALHTSKHALEQGRDVFAVPGRISDPASLGCHDLIRDGAVLIRGAEDVLEGIQWRFPSECSPSEATPPSDVSTKRKSKATPISPPPPPCPVVNLSPEEQRLVEGLGNEAVPIDRLLVESSQPADEILPMLTILEMKRVIRRLPGGYIERTRP